MKAVFVAVIMFAAGLLLGVAAQGSAQSNLDIPSAAFETLTGTAVPRDAPGDHLTENEISVYKDRVLLDVRDPIYARFTPTNSMSPVFDHNANAIEVKPRTEADVQVGDIIAYTNPNFRGTVIHRVIQKGEDARGTYYIVKGDNNARADPYPVRFDDIVGVVVAVIY